MLNSCLSLGTEVSVANERLFFAQIFPPKGNIHQRETYNITRSPGGLVDSLLLFRYFSMSTSFTASTPLSNRTPEPVLTLQEIKQVNDAQKMSDLIDAEIAAGNFPPNGLCRRFSDPFLDDCHFMDCTPETQTDTDSDDEIEWLSESPPTITEAVVPTQNVSLNLKPNGPPKVYTVAPRGAKIQKPKQ